MVVAFFLAASAVAADRPNVILIMTDDQGYGDLGVTGNPVLKTPHIDRLAAEGVWMTRFYVSPVCNPTRASLLTGRYNYRTRSVDTYIGRSMMEPSEVTVAETLRDAGYATGIFGKWHLGDCYPMRAMDQGFTESLVIKGGGLRQPANPPDGDSYFDPILWHNGKPVRGKGFCTDIYFDAAIKFVESRNKAEKPFFAYIATNAPHDPFEEVPEKEYAQYKNLTANDRDARIFAMVANIDSNVGRLLARLDELKIADNTLVIFLTDNGPAGQRYNARMRGQKASVYEGGIRTAFFARWPSRFQAGLRRAEPAAHIDVTPTILDACGLLEQSRDRKGAIPLDGRSLVPLLTSENKPWPARTLFLQWHRGDVPVLHRNFAAIADRWKLLQRMGQETLPGENRFELYDLPADPGESTDLAAKHPEVVADLKRQYEEWFRDVSSTRPDNYAPPRIVLGHEGTSPVILTRQDVRADAEGGGGWWVTGGWHVRVEKPGSYTARVRLREPAPADSTVKLTVGSSEKETPIKAGEIECVFDGVPLEPGDTKLLASLNAADPVKNGVFQVYISW